MRLLLACVLFAPASVVLAQTVAPVERAEVKRLRRGTDRPLGQHIARGRPLHPHHRHLHRREPGQDPHIDGGDGRSQDPLRLGNAAGVKVLFDPSFRDQRVSIRFEEEALEPALDQLILPLRLFLTVIEGDAIVIAPDSPELRQRYEQRAPPVVGGAPGLARRLT
jgi:hypothetical protein